MCSSLGTSAGERKERDGRDEIPYRDSEPRREKKSQVKNKLHDLFLFLPLSK
jgi:hypothetical protein